MIYERDQILNDLSAFADLGTDAPTIVSNGDDLVARIVRESYPMVLIFHPDASVTERHNGSERRHANFRALLASQSFASLGKWADSQTIQLRGRVKQETLPIEGELSGMEATGGIDFFDNALVAADTKPRPRTIITLVNGPAGIGKTSLIRSTAYRRAENYRRQQRTLLLHVESRGRVLQNLTDLMAFSLQTLRLSVTYDQIPALVRNGLVTLAIDGFDELGDPSGYDLAWAQVNDLIVASRGQGNILLAGRETFISKERMELALTAVDQKFDRLQIYSLRPLRPAAARTWLRSSGWSDEMLALEVVAPLFEEGSYALRPFFLSELAREGVASQIQKGAIDDLLSFLITAMIEREANKFGREIEVATTEKERVDFIQRLMEEVARDLAENQSDAIPSDTLIWLAEIVASEIVKSNLVGVLKNRAGVVAFLGEDDRRGYRRFVHEQVSNYFLSHATIRSISSGETPKYVRRNIFGLEFLENFCSVFRYKKTEATDNFFRSAIHQIDFLGDEDRARGNLASLVLAGCSVTGPTFGMPTIKNVSMDEAYLAESITEIRLESVTIGQMYARDADIRQMQFSKDCFIASLIADDGTMLPKTFPLPSLISLPGETLTEPKAKRNWLIRHRSTSSQSRSGVGSAQKLLDKMELFNLLSRVARYKPFWLKDGEERAARRILDDPNWDILKKVMLDHDLIIERHDVQAAGRPGPFYHVRNRERFLHLDKPAESIQPFLTALFDENLRMRGFFDEV